MIFSALRIVLVVLLSESINGPSSNPVVLLFFGLDHTSSFEIIHTRIDDRQFVWYYFYVWSQILSQQAHNVYTTLVLGHIYVTSYECLYNVATAFVNERCFTYV